MIDLEPSWLAQLQDEFAKPYMKQLRAFLVEEKRQGKIIFPASSNWFNAFRQTPFAACLLYTSDAADERSSVDLGGRRIIKKKKIAIAQRRVPIKRTTIQTHLYT